MTLIVGVDEVGRGCLAGPVYAAAVVMGEKQILAGLKDSKLLSKQKRNELFELIVSNCYEYSLGSQDNKEIDQLNILNASLRAMELAVGQLKMDFKKVLRFST